LLPTIPLRYMLALLIILAVTYGVSGYVIFTAPPEENEFDYSYEQNEYYDFDPENNSNINEGEQSWIDRVNKYLGYVVDGIVTLFKVATFDLPHMPSSVRVVMNFILIPMGVVFLIGLIPYILAIIDRILVIADIIVPDWL